MGIIRGFSLMFLANGIALYLAGMVLPEISISQTVEGFAITAATLTLINLLIKPLVRLALGPILLLTLGLGSILVNAVTLLFLDVLLPTITIDGLTNLFVAALIVGMSNLVISLTARFI
ncbi:MAG: phage holin family protein [Candidatus Colwellbacteria bacterium]|nr:phage holin family protein [Candidatus Colwellbacteria bacterium]